MRRVGAVLLLKPILSLALTMHHIASRRVVRAAARAAQDDDGKRDSISNGAVMEAEKEFLAATKQGAGFEDISPLEMPLKGE